jgi:hypothetical protein
MRESHLCWTGTLKMDLSTPGKYERYCQLTITPASA